ncbi:DUF4855 domain-containing protein [Paenibacillus alvei]|uniref:DUF4855 domain-containing protein n=1 Tax=Paenibacillus alvei TaxID=44250 RepID=UPI003D2E6FBA
MMKKKWLSIVMSTVLALSMMAPIVQAEEAKSLLQAGEQNSPQQADEPQQGVRNLALGLPYEWSQAPEAGYADDGYKLTDGKYGKMDKSDPAWVGHLKKRTREVVFDLGENKSISSVKAHFLQDWPNNNVLLPLTVSIYVSDDKENWGLLSHNALQTLWIDGQHEETFEWKGSKDGIKNPNKEGLAYGGIAYARYVKVSFMMHPRAMTLVDEIEIMGEDGKVQGADTVPTQTPAYQTPGEATAGISDLGLLYNGHYANNKGDWTKERIIPNISYVDEAGNPKDWLFDGILYLGLDTPSGRNLGLNGKLDDWKWYLEKTFAAQGDMYQLNEATKEVGAKLNDPNHKTKVVYMIPFPVEGTTNFGDIGDGNLSFSDSIGVEQAFANRVKAVHWWLDQVKQKWDAANYSNLELVGMYWLDEQISTHRKGPDMLRETSAKVHDMGMKLFWIPFFSGYKTFMWKDVGIDNVAYQPNYFFEEDIDPERLQDAAYLSKQHGMGNELEFDDRMLTDNHFREKYIEYLNNGAENGFMQNGYNAYYQGNDAVYHAAVSKDPSNRILYDWLYQFVKGTYSVNSGIPSDAEVQMNGQPIESHTKVPATETVQFTWKLKDDDGSGAAKVTATFDGKPYTAGTPINLAGKLGKHELTVTVTSGKSKKTTYMIEAGTNVDLIKTFVDQFEKENQFNNDAAAGALQTHLDNAKQAEGSAEEFKKHIKIFNAMLEFQKIKGQIADGAYNTLKDHAYYLLGNMAENKTVEASSVEANNPNYMPQKAVDGFPGTRWASNYVDHSWFMVDFGDVKEFDTIRIDWEYARAKTYKILVSQDKKEWVNVTSKNDGVITAQDGRDTIHFTPTEARYVKFEGIQRNTDYGYSFYEFGIYNIFGADGMKTLENVESTK